MQFSIDPHRLEELLTYCIGFAQEMLTRCGEFFPFGAVIKQGGEFAAVGGDVGKEHPPSQEVYQFLHGAFQRDFLEGKIEAAALAANVDIPAQFSPPYPDGIRILIECRGYARMFYVPYALKKPSLLGKILRRRGTLKIEEAISVDVPPSLIGKASEGGSSS